MRSVEAAGALAGMAQVHGQPERRQQTSLASATQKPGWRAVRGLPAPVTRWQPVTRAVTVPKCRDPAVKYSL